VARAADGFVLAGLTSRYGGNSDVWVVKINDTGGLVWQRTYGNSATDDTGRGVVRDGNSYFVVGYTNVKAEEDYDFLLLKLDTSGNMIWNQTYGGTQSDKGYAISQASNGYVLVGDTRSKGNGDDDAWAVKVDSEGNIEWETAFGGKDFDMATCVTNSADGGFLVGGFTFSFGHGKRDFWLTKLDGSGKEPLSFTQGGVNYEEAYSVLEAGNDEYVMTGWRNYFESGPYDYYVAKISPANDSVVFPVFIFVGSMLLVVAMLVAVFAFLKIRKKRSLSSEAR
jgi:hypothetical protein